MAKKGLSDIFKDTEVLPYDGFLAVIKNYAATNSLDGNLTEACLDIEIIRSLVLCQKTNRSKNHSKKVPSTKIKK